MNQLEFRLNDGNKIPALGLGTWQLTGRKCVQAVKTALKLGYRHIDTAELYENQAEIGEAIKDFDRRKLFLTSKVWFNNLRYDDVLASCEKTLKELKTNYLDLFLIHWPNRQIPLKETLDAFKELLNDGRVESVGVSNFTIHHLKDALKIAKAKAVSVPITVNQVEFHPRFYQKELLEFCKKNKIVVTAYSPLGRGALLEDKTLKEIAARRGKTPAQVCLRWALEKGAVVIPKASSEEHLKENLRVFGWRLSKQDAEKIDSLNKNERIIAPNFSDFDY